jgi:hypothetical protein
VVRTGKSIEVANQLRAVVATAVQRARAKSPHPKSVVTFVAGSLSALLHLGLLLLLVNSGGQPGTPGDEHVILVDNFAPRRPLEELPRKPDRDPPPPSAADAESAPPQQATVEQPEHPELAAPSLQPFDTSSIATPTLLDEVIESALTFADQESTTPAPPLPSAIDLPRTRTVDIAPAEQTSLIERIARAAKTLTEAESEVAWQEDGREYRALLKRDPSIDSTELETVSADVTTIDQGMSMHTKLLLSRLAFSQFTQVVDRWDPNVQLHDDEIVGRFHSNSALFIGYDSQATPKFTGKVTTAARRLRFANGSSPRRREAMFQGGLQTFADRIELPQQAAPFVLDPPDENAHVHRFSDDVHITLHSDGSYSWQERKAAIAERRQYSTSSTVYLLAAPDVTLFVRGAIRGRVLAYSPERIVIEGSLTYVTDPRNDDGSNDYLGIVSDGNVEIARPYVTGRGDLKIDAAIFARRRFLVTDIDHRRPAKLWIYGSLTAGSLSATEPRYATKVEFDSRFDSVRPPGFPSTNRYEVASWDPAWREASTLR